MIYLGTFAAIAVVATLSVFIYRSAVNDAVTQHENQQLAMVRTAAVAIESEINAMAARLRQFNSMPSVQNLDVDVLSQRVQAAFGDNAAGLIEFIGRADTSGQLYLWAPNGTLIAKGKVPPDPALVAWASDRANANALRMIHGWAEGQSTVSSRRALVMPVWRTAASAEQPEPQNDFAGMIAIVIDINRFVQVYPGAARSDFADTRLVVGLATPDSGVRMGPNAEGVSATPADPHQHREHQGTAVLDDGDGRRLHAWSKLAAIDEEWLVASSANYSLVAGQIQRSAMAQLALTSVLLIAVPIAGFLIARRERRIQAEQRELERRLAESQKMEAIGKLAGGIAHDFNNMLTAILGYASMIQEDAPPRSAIRDQAVAIRRSAESAATLTQKLLAFSRKQVLQSDALDFRSMLGNLLQLVRGAVGEDITVTTQMGDELWPVLADQGQLEQAILNLALNARDAMPKGGTLQIDARNTPRPRGEHRPDVDVKPGQYVQITVTDTGVGMDETTQRRMFEPFFTTKAPGQGTGLGLSTVYGFVRQCGGYISVLSTPGQGTSIQLLLPRANAPATVTPTPCALAAHAAATPPATILVAEDEEGVRALVLETLRRRGFQVLAAPSAEEALQLAAGHDGAIHLLISDVVLPGMKGPELADRMRAMRPGIRVLLMSGYAADVVTPNDLKGTPLMAKPFSPAALVKAVQAIVDSALSSPPASQA